MAIPESAGRSPAGDEDVASVRHRLPYAEIFDAMQDAVLVADRDAAYVAANAAAEALTGYSTQELRALRVPDLVVGAPEATEAVFRRFVDEGGWRGSVRVRRKDGSIVEAEARAVSVSPQLFVSVLREAGPAVGGATGATSAELAAIVESSNDAIFSKTLDGTILSWNRAAERIYGYTAEEVVGQHVSILAPDDRESEISQILERLRRGEDVRDFRTKRVTRGGQILDIWLSISPIRDASGRIVAAATIARDVTEQVRIEEQLRAAHDRLEIITAASADGITIQDRSSSIVYANDAAATMSGYPDAASFLAAPIEEVLDRFELLTEDGRPFRLDELPGRRVLAGEPEAEALLRVRDLVRGVETWRFVRATALRDEAGGVRYVVNVFHDVTDLKAAEEQLRFRTLLLEAQMEASDEAVLVIDADGRIASWNRRLLAMLQLDEDDVRGQTAEALLTRVAPTFVDPDETADRLRRLWAHPDRDAHDEIRFADGRIFERFSTPLRDEAGRFYGRVSFFREVTAERKRERAQRFLAEASRELVASLDYEATLQRVASLAVPELADWCAVDVLEPDGAIRLLAVAHVDPAKITWAHELRKRFPPDLHAQQGIGSVIRTGRPELYPTVSMDQIAATTDDPELLAVARQLQISSVMVVPLVARGRTLGTMQFVWAESGRSYDEGDLTVAEDLAGRAALALDNARLYGERDQIAQTLQQSLLPGPLPSIDGVRLAARYRAAGRGVEVGGDFYDVFDQGDGAYALVVGDVCGKGPRSAALMGAARHTIRTAAMRERRPGDVLRVLNTALHQRLVDQWFCTVAFVRLRRSAAGGRLTVACGGHPLPAVLRADGTVEFVGRPGSLLGVFPDVEITDTVVDLQTGDTLVLYTDGVTDEQSDGEEFGEDRLADSLRRLAGRPADEIAVGIEEAVVAFRSQELSDDLALLVATVVD